MKLPLKHIILGIAGITVLIGAWTAYRQTSEAFAATGLDLRIGNTSYFNGSPHPSTSWTLSDITSELFYNFSNFLPGDWQESTIELQVTGYDSWLCHSLEITENDDTSCTEPELIDDPTCTVNADVFDGDLATNLEVLFWADDGDNVLETDETIIYSGDFEGFEVDQAILADSTTNYFSGLSSDPLLADTSYFLGTASCFGTLNQSPVTTGSGIDPTVDPGFTCDGEPQTNATQTDTLLGNLSFLSVQADVNPDYTCGTCSINGSFGADVVTEFNQALRRDGTPVNADRSNLSSALGLPEGTIASGTFVSLGFGGNLILETSEPIEDLVGNDFSIYEITGGGSYPEETADILVSQDNITYENIGTLSSLSSQPFGFNISSTTFSWIRYIQIIDTSDPGLFDTRPNADGIDIDGIIANNQNICL